MHKILVIDGDPQGMAAVQAALGDLGYSTLGAATVGEGLATALRELPHLIVCELELPDGDGFGLLRTLRKYPRSAMISVVLTAAEADAAVIREGMKLGADDFLPKPWQPDCLRDAVAVQIQKRETILQQAEDQVRTLTRAVEQSPTSIVITNVEGNIEYVNPKFTELTGYTYEEVCGQNPRLLKAGETPPQVYRDLWTTLSAGNTWRGELHNRKKNGELFWEWASISPVLDPAGSTTHFVAVKEDITERKRAEEERQKVEIQLRHAQKLESIGQLAAGIAHEINTPTQFIGDNTRFLRDGFADLKNMIERFQQMLAAIKKGGWLPDLVDETEATARAADLEFLLEEIPNAIGQSLSGLERVGNIVRAMKEFSHPGTNEMTSIDLNHAIESTVTVCRNEWKYVADLVTEFDRQLPSVPCLPGELNQVILNLIVNAAHAIDDRPDKGEKGAITIGTRHDRKWAEISVSDTGAGIPDEARDRVFDPFFTTKEVGRGTGQGLAIARSLIVDKHGGEITFNTELGRGTTFYIRLPLVNSARQAEPQTS